MPLSGSEEGKGGEWETVRRRRECRGKGEMRGRGREERRQGRREGMREGWERRWVV